MQLLRAGQTAFLQHRARGHKARPRGGQCGAASDVGRFRVVLRCPGESQSSPFTLHEGVRAGVGKYIWTLFFLLIETTKPADF